jgi:hypothetical protein
MPSDRPAGAAELLRYRSLGMLIEESTTPVEVQRRARRIRRLRRDLGFSYDAIAVIERLVERIEELERQG